MSLAGNQTFSMRKSISGRLIVLANMKVIRGRGPSGSLVMTADYVDRDGLTVAGPLKNAGGYAHGFFFLGDGSPADYVSGCGGYLWQLADGGFEDNALYDVSWQGSSLSRDELLSEINRWWGTRYECCPMAHGQYGYDVHYYDAGGCFPDGGSDGGRDSG